MPQPLPAQFQFWLSNVGGTPPPPPSPESRDDMLRWLGQQYPAGAPTTPPPPGAPPDPLRAIHRDDLIAAAQSLRQTPPPFAQNATPAPQGRVPDLAHAAMRDDLQAAARALFDGIRGAATTATPFLGGRTPAAVGQHLARPLAPVLTALDRTFGMVNAAAYGGVQALADPTGRSGAVRENVTAAAHGKPYEGLAGSLERWVGKPMPVVMRALVDLVGDVTNFGDAPFKLAGVAALPLFRGATAAREAAKPVVYAVDNLVEWQQPFIAAAKRAGFDDRVIESATGLVDRTIELYKQHPDQLPLTSTTKRSMIKGNADFGSTADVDRICKRAAQFWKTVDAIEARLNRPMVEDEFLRLAQEMRKAGDIPGCVFCYVEAGRRAQANMMFNLSSTSLADAELLHAADPRSKLHEYVRRRDAWLREAEMPLTDYQRMAVTPSLREEMKARGGAHAALAQDYEDYIGSAKSTALEGHSLYRGELLGKQQASIDHMFEAGGMRWWSATDFAPTHLVETFKALADMTVKRMPAHGYTKEPYAVLILGDTGMKLNLSIAATWDGTRFVSDNVNGMPWEVALALRKRYPNAGTMFVAKNMDDLKWALKNPQIDMIIPHHAANWTGGPSKYGVFDLGDFTQGQYDTWIDKGRKGSPKTEFGERLKLSYWLRQTGNDEQKAVRAYLDFCKKNGIRPKWSGQGNYLFKGTKTPQPDFTAHPGYAKLIKDYGRTDTPMTAVDVTKVDEGRAREYALKYVEEGGWDTRPPNPATVDAGVALFQRGSPVTLEELAETEAELRRLPPPTTRVDTLSSLGISRTGRPTTPARTKSKTSTPSTAPTRAGKLAARHSSRSEAWPGHVYGGGATTWSKADYERAYGPHAGKRRR